MIAEDIIKCWTFDSEREFTKRVNEWLRLEWFWSYKIRDDSAAEKPFDIVWIKDWSFYAIECKYLNKPKKKNYTIDEIEENSKAKLEIHQYLNLSLILEKQWYSYIFTYYDWYLYIIEHHE